MTEERRPVRQVFRAGPIAILATETVIATIPALWSVEVLNVLFYNQSGASRTVTGHTYDSGGSAGTSNEFMSEVITTKASSSKSGWALGPGGVISAIADDVGCTAWFYGEVVTEAKQSQ